MYLYYSIIDIISIRFYYYDDTVEYVGSTKVRIGITLNSNLHVWWNIHVKKENISFTNRPI